MAELFNNLIDALTSGFMQFGIRDAIDILVIAFVIYKLIKLTSNTRAMQVIKGLGVLFIAASVSELLRLTTITWLLNQIIRAGAIALIIIFQPELRRALEQIGRSKLFHKNGAAMDIEVDRCIEELVLAMRNMSSHRIGALLIMEERTGLADIIATGTEINARISTALIENIFVPNTPLHDGATIIRGTGIVASGCFLPLSDNNSISRLLGTRHRAALGVSEVSDCHAFVVSEETGVISVAHDGRLTRFLDDEQIRELLREIYKGDTPVKDQLFAFLRRKKERE